MPRRTWLDNKIDVFLEELAASGMHLDRQRAGELITGQIRAAAALMRVTEATARTYLDDETIKELARRMLFEVADERPGADLLEAPRTVPLPLVLVGITVAALAEAMQVRAANEPPDHLADIITTYAQTLSGLGQITAGAAPEQPGNPPTGTSEPGRPPRHVGTPNPGEPVTTEQHPMHPPWTRTPGPRSPCVTGHGLADAIICGPLTAPAAPGR